MDGIPSSRRQILLLLGSAGLLLLAGYLGILRAEQISDGSGRLVRQQIVWSVLGVGLSVAVNCFDFRRLAHCTPAIYCGIITALLAVYAFAPVNGAHRWIRIAGIGV